MRFAIFIFGAMFALSFLSAPSAQASSKRGHVQLVHHKHHHHKHHKKH